MGVDGRGGDADDVTLRAQMASSLSLVVAFGKLGSVLTRSERIKIIVAEST